MKTSNVVNKKTSGGAKVAGALGLAAGVAAAVAAGIYFYGKDGNVHRKQVSDWAKKAKTDMLGKIKQMKDVSKTAYDKAADEILAKYKLVKNIDPMELRHFGQELKSHWTQISKEAAKLSGKGRAKKSA